MWLLRYSVFGETPAALYCDYYKELTCYDVWNFWMPDRVRHDGRSGPAKETVDFNQPS
jgi:hypothetical protein